MTIITLLFSLMLPLVVPFAAIAVIVHLVGKNTKETGPAFVELPDSAVREEQKTAERPPMNTSNILLLIGTAFVILSGIAFGAAGWVRTSDIGRVLIIAAASAVAFLLSFMFRKVMKLENTSAAFYALGSFLTAITFLVAGAYSIMGSWLSFDGEGFPTLIGLSLCVVIVPAFIGRTVFGSKTCTYLAASAGAAAVFAFISQMLMYHPFTTFAAVLICAQAAITAVLHAVPLVKSKAVRTVGDIAAVIYAVIASAATITVFDEPAAEHFFIIGILYAQFTFYGISKNKDWMKAIQSAVGVYGILGITAGLYQLDTRSDIHLFWMSVLLMALYAANRAVPSLHTGFGTVFTYIFAGLGSFLAMFSGITESPVLFLIVPLAFTALAYLDCFSRNNALQVYSGIAAPLMVCLMTSAVGAYADEHIRNMTSRELNTAVIGTAMIVLMAITAVIIFLPQINFQFHATHPRTSDTVLWTSMIVTGTALFSCLRWSELIWLPAFAAAAHIALSHKLKNNITAVASAIALPVMIFDTIAHYTEYGSTARTAVCFGMILTYMALSKLFFPERMVNKSEDSTVRIDFLMLSGWVGFLFFSYSTGAERFFAKIALAVYIACFVKKSTSKDKASALLTISAVITSYALITRPFFIAESAMVSSKITLAITALTGLAVRFIWKHHKSAAETASSVIFVASFAGLILDAMRFHNAGNTIFVMAVTLVLLFIACAAKSKTWFTASFAALVIITLYSTRKYLMALDWWVYLFIAGIVLIGAAAFNEYCKKNDSDIRSTVRNKFSGWKW